MSGLCIAYPSPEPACETFIQAHIDGLEPDQAWYGGHLPLFDSAGQPLLPDLPQEWRELFSVTGVPETDLHHRAAQGLADQFTKRDVDLVLAEYGPTGVALAEPCGLANVPLVVHFHGYDASLLPVLDKYRQGYQRMFEQAAALVAVSKEMERDLKSMGAPKDKIFLAPYGVNTTLFTVGDPAQAGPVFVAVGRFVDKKAPETTLLAFARVLAEAPEARLAMIGDGVLRDSCIRLAQGLGIAHAVDFPGNLPHQDVARAMNQARCFVQHSLTPASGDKEGMPNSVLEASASGLPVVATRHAGIPESVEHGVSGLLCAERDMEAMAEHMLVLARDPEKARTMGLEGRKRMEKRFHAPDCLAALARILEQALEQTKDQGAGS